MKILFFGDSITDAGRARGTKEAGRLDEVHDYTPRAYGAGYVFLASAELSYERPGYYEILNRGIGGDRLPQLYARAYLDVWKEDPDVLSILVGVNDVNTGSNRNYTDIERWGRVYRMMISDTLEKCPNTKIMICEPFDLRENPEVDTEKGIGHINQYAAEARLIAEEFGLPFVALKGRIDEAARIYGAENICHDGVHPALAGAKIIADEWLKVFKSEILGEDNGK